MNPKFMNPEFIIAINKIHQYGEVGDRKCGSLTAMRKLLQDLKVLKLISVTNKCGTIIYLSKNER
jgi:hypothetical protein